MDNVETPNQVQPINTPPVDSNTAATAVNTEIGGMQTQEQKKENQFITFIKPLLKNKKVIISLGVLILLLVISTVLTSIFGKPTSQDTDIEKEPTEPTPVVEEKDPDWQEVNNRQYEFSFKYPTEAQLIEENPFSLDPSSYTVLYTRLEHEETDLNETNLREGYIFRIIVNKTSSEDTPLALSEGKLRYYNSYCPDKAEYKEIVEGTVSGFPSASFKVDNCEGNYRHTYVSRDSQIFEVLEYYKGDLGYRERYAANVDEMFRSFDLTNRNEPAPSSTWVEYLNIRGDIAFKHPDMDFDCCNVEGPAILSDQEDSKNSVEKIIVFAKKGTPEDSQKPFNGFAVYIVKDRNSDSFDQYVEDQKKALEENYQVIIGRNPEGKEKRVEVGNKEGVLLEGYAWWGDIIFVNDGNRVIVISKTEESKGSFDTEFGEILQTFEFEVEG